jgi:diphthine synthase
VEEDKPFLKKNTSLLVYGDPLSATTHLEILQEAEKKNIKVKIIHAPSIMTTIAETGLQLYKFGKTASIPFWTENHKPESFFDLLEQNQSIGAHTLCLLDLDPENEKFLSISEAISRILEISNSRNTAINENTKFIGCSRLGMKDGVIKYGNQNELSKIDFGKAPFCLVLPGKLNFSEEEFIER